MARDKKRTIVFLLVILIAWLPLFMAAWDKGQPVEGGLAPDLNDVIRANNDALEAALNAWLYFETGGVQTGRPRRGSARPYFQDAVPTARLDGDYFTSDDYGTPWIDSNATIDNQFNILTVADGAGTETWTPISTEVIAVLLAANRVFAGTLKSTGDFTVGANKVVVTAATGNTAIAGTLGVTGIATVGDGSKNATSAAPDADAELANKKYVDDQDTADHPAYSGGESHTDGSGLIMKMGNEARAGADTTVTFGTAFPTGLISITVTPLVANTGLVKVPAISSSSTSSFTITTLDAFDSYNWIAIGY